MTTATTSLIEPPALDDVADASDEHLVHLMQAWTAARRRVDAGLAVLAAEIARRSGPEHGLGGIAQRSGARTPEALVAKIVGATAGESRDLIAAGRLVTAPEPWLEVVARGVDAGELSVAAAAAIGSGLGSPTAHVAADDLADAARQLILESLDLTPEQTRRRAQEHRDELDAVGVEDREAARRERRYLRLTPQSDGMTRIHGLLDPESAAIVTDAFDLVTSPRRGGPRFVDPAHVARAQRIIDDPRTTGQLALDALVDIVRIAGAADDGTVFGVREPAVRVHVALSDLDRGRGAASVEGQPAAISVSSATRLACTGGYLPVLFDDRGALDLGRTQRLFSRRQRAVLAAIWGGCAMPGCDRPPSWTEAHHIDEWHRDGGRTDVADGILLCRHHHRLVHDGGWRIERRPDGLVLAPNPADGVPRPIRLEPKNPVRRRMLRRGRIDRTEL